VNDYDLLSTDEDIDWILPSTQRSCTEAGVFESPKVTLDRRKNMIKVLDV